MEEVLKWRKIDDEELYVHKHAITLPDNRVFELSIHRVAFGYRVIGQYARSRMSIELNWCCGDNKLVIYASYKILMDLIERGASIDDIPFSSDIKPWPKDRRFIDRVSKLIGNPLLSDLVSVIDNTAYGNK